MADDDPSKDSHETGLASLPNELLTTILSLLPTADLLPLTPVSRRIYNLIVRIVNQRLSELASSLEEADSNGSTAGRRVLLECHPPSAHGSVMPWECEVQDCNIGEEREESLKGLSTRYSLFTPRPSRPPNTRLSRLHPAGGPVSFSTQNEGPSVPSPNVPGSVRQTISFDGHQLFSQLCVAAHVIERGPREGVFRRFTTLERGVVRVWRPALGEERDGDEGDVYWVGAGERVGLRMAVGRQMGDREMISPCPREEDAVCFEVVVDSLLIRTTHLLLSLEDSLLRAQSEDESNLGRAVVFGSFLPIR